MAELAELAEIKNMPQAPFGLPAQAGDFISNHMFIDYKRLSDAEVKTMKFQPCQLNVQIERFENYTLNNLLL